MGLGVRVRDRGLGVSCRGDTVSRAVTQCRQIVVFYAFRTSACRVK